jgi:hypothetical protein
VLGLLAYQLWPEGEGRRVAWQDLTAQTGPLTITRETKRLFREENVFNEYVAGAGGEAPTVDFSRRQVLLVSPGPRSSTGYVVEILDVRERDGELTVTVRERTPSLNDRVGPRVTFPYRLLGLPAGRDVYVDWPGR